MDTTASRNKSESKAKGGQTGQKPSAKLRGLPKDSPEIRVSKTVSWLLRHGAQSEGLKMRPDGCVKVADLLANPKLKSQSLDVPGLQEMVKADKKQRFGLVFEEDPSNASEGEWWIKANQGHSIKTVELVLIPILKASDIPSGIAVHGTDAKAWKLIAQQGLSKMKRNHIHLAQGIAGENVVSGMRKSSQIFIFINVQKALDAGIKFHLSDNGVVLTEGDSKGILSKEYFDKVEDATRTVLQGWDNESTN